MPKTTSHPLAVSIKHQFTTVCQQIHLGDGCECTYAQVTVNKILSTVACSFRSGAEGSYSTTSVVISRDAFVGAAVVQLNCNYRREPQANLSLNPVILLGFHSIIKPKRRNSPNIRENLLDFTRI